MTKLILPNKYTNIKNLETPTDIELRPDDLSFLNHIDLRFDEDWTLFLRLDWDYYTVPSIRLKIFENNKQIFKIFIFKGFEEIIAFTNELNKLFIDSDILLMVSTTFSALQQLNKENT